MRKKKPEAKKGRTVSVVLMDVLMAPREHEVELPKRCPNKECRANLRQQGALVEHVLHERGFHVERFNRHGNGYETGEPSDSSSGDMHATALLCAACETVIVGGHFLSEEPAWRIRGEEINIAEFIREAQLSKADRDFLLTLAPGDKVQLDLTRRGSGLVEIERDQSQMQQARAHAKTILTKDVPRDDNADQLARLIIKMFGEGK